MQSVDGRRNKNQRCATRRRAVIQSTLAALFLIPAGAATRPPHPIPIAPSIPQVPTSRSDVFTLRHIFHHGTHLYPDLHKRLDVTPTTKLIFNPDTTSHDDPTYFDPAAVVASTQSPPVLSVTSERYEIDRLADRSWSAIQSYIQAAEYIGSPRVLDASYWTRDVVPGPNTTDRQTVINLAYMAANAYVPVKFEGDWTNVTGGYNDSTPFGWEGDGLRGHVFANENNETIIVGLKGTSPAVFDGDGTTTHDKLNDNLFFSCCCGQGGQYFWRQVCDCQTSTYTCNSTCLVKSLKAKTKYYAASVDLYNNITELYPDSNVWIVGHSLGGAVSALLGLTFGLPVVTFEAPGDDLAARRLGLPVPASPKSGPDPPNRGKYTGARHFGHTADPVFMGTCNGPTATCTLGGYAMESQCHTGLQCVYDTVGDLGWRAGIGYHKIHGVIDDVIRKYKDVPKCVPDTECIDCYNWKYFESNGSESTTTTRLTTSPTSKTTYTRTSTCKTPGWWGCLDSSSAASRTTPVVTTTYTTTTCLTPGWFGCKESSTVTVTTTTEAPSRISSEPRTNSVTTTTKTRESSQCTPNFFFGCPDDETSTSRPSRSRYRSTATVTTTSSICETPGLFFGCHDKHPHSTVVTETSTITKAPKTISASASTTRRSTVTSSTNRERGKCRHPAFFGLICLDNTETDPTPGADPWLTRETQTEYLSEL